MKRSRVTTTDFYGAWEVIKGRKSLPKTVTVHWPNGNMNILPLVTKCGHASAQVDMNNCPDHFRTRELFVVANLNGHSVRIPLRELSFSL